MGEQGNPAFNQALLKRFVNLMGLFPVGNLVRLDTERDRGGHRRAPDRSVPAAGEDHRRRARATTLEEPLLANTWERDARGEHPYAVVEAVDPESTDIDPLKYL